MTFYTNQWSAPDENNSRLAILCGPFDSNLRQIEKLLSVHIRRRGLSLKITGNKRTVEQTTQLLEKLFFSNSDISAEEIELAAIKLKHTQTMQITQNLTDQESSLVILKTQKSQLQARTANQNLYIEQIQKYDINFGIGPAGTGKTFLAVACAVNALETDQVDKIILTRPAVEAGERLGFLPGDLNQKVDPYLKPLYDGLYEIAGFEKVQKWLERNMIEIAPLAYMRGRSLNRAFIILDEAQNTTPEQMKMFLTRIGFRSKSVITGDLTQIDLPRGQQSGLTQAQAILKNIQEIGMTFFEGNDVIRHPLIKKIINAYDQYEQKTNPKPL